MNVLEEETALVGDLWARDAAWCRQEVVWNVQVN